MMHKNVKMPTNVGIFSSPEGSSEVLVWQWFVVNTFKVVNILSRWTNFDQISSKA